MARSRLKCQVASSQFWILTSRSRALRQEDLERPRREGRSLGPRRSPGRFADQGGLGPFLEHDQRVAQVDAALMGQPDQAEQRGFELDPPGHIEQRPAGPERRVQGGEDIVGGRDGLGQQIPVERARDDP